MKKTAKLGRFEIKEIQSGARQVWQLSGYKNSGERVRRRFKTREEALGKKHLLEVESVQSAASARPRLTRLSEDELAVCEKALGMLMEGGSLIEAVTFYNRNFRRPDYAKALPEALEEFRRDDEELQRIREVSREAIAVQVGLLARALPGRQVHEIAREDIDAFLAGERVATRRTKLNKLSSFFNWGLDPSRRYCGANPITGKTRRPEPKQRREESPAIFSAEQARALLAAALRPPATGKRRGEDSAALVPWLSLALFAGLRAEELKRIGWESIRLDEGIIRVEGGAAKTATARVVEIPPNLAAWLAPYAAARAPIYPRNHRKLFEGVRARAGIADYVRDICRHSAVSHHYATTGLKEKTAAWAGHSPQILDRHYRGLVSAAEAARYWSITPENVHEEPVVSLQEASA